MCLGPRSVCVLAKRHVVLEHDMYGQNTYTQLVWSYTGRVKPKIRISFFRGARNTGTPGDRVNRKKDFRFLGVFRTLGTPEHRVNKKKIGFLPVFGTLGTPNTA